MTEFNRITAHINGWISPEGFDDLVKQIAALKTDVARWRVMAIKRDRDNEKLVQLLEELEHHIPDDEEDLKHRIEIELRCSGGVQ